MTKDTIILEQKNTVGKATRQALDYCPHIASCCENSDGFFARNAKACEVSPRQ